MKFEKISKLFWNHGAKISDSIKNHKKLKKKFIENLFKEYGLILFRGLDFKINNIKSFSDKFTKAYANDARRREKTTVNKFINGVDEGYSKMTLHSEASFSPSWPEILWFYCQKPSKKFGETTFCDGIKLWSILSTTAKNFFLEYPLKFTLKIPVIKPMNFKQKKIWPLNKIGAANSFLNYKDGCLYVDQIRFAVSETNIDNKLSFCNHFLYENTDPTILKWRFVGVKNFPKEIKKEVKNKSDSITYYHKWKKNDFIMLDNRRFMHGRNKILKSDNKKIYNIQTLLSNIPRKIIYFKKT
tara:strand:+ start:71 stop:967 length:897 start_codon:yes stop_codon:yes gene_type:complete